MYVLRDDHPDKVFVDFENQNQGRVKRFPFDRLVNVSDGGLEGKDSNGKLDKEFTDGPRPRMPPSFD